jgi:plastocyanin
MRPGEAYGAREDEMKARETQARAGAGGRAAAPARRLLAGVLLGVVGAAVMAAPAGGGASTTGAADVVVRALPSNQFDVDPATISQGESVTWTNAGGRHNVVFDDGRFTYPPTASTDAWTSPPLTFNEVGTFRYYCAVHGGPGGVGMAGRVTVNPPPGAPPGQPAPPQPGPPGTPPGPPGTPPPGAPDQPGASPPGSPPGAPGPVTPPGGKLATTVTLKVSDATPSPGEGVRFFGSVRPQQDGRFVQLQRRSRRGSYTTVTRIRLKDAGSSRSKFSKRLRVLRDAVFRARLPADATHKADTSRARRVKVR